ncbi:MAG: SDR family NAD(P)-dependent oxidoreductase [Bacteroidia bacterium]|nr:SDR family NAD(P)-dependent oxidoreductase [Bacteroidia bacterium]MDW8015297.1 SDR family NAD(P)-dependent oxidoreductase [Bacteroidia bacterium]
MHTWLITGANRGIGRAIAEVVLEAGHRVILTARRVEALREIHERYPEQTIAFPLDVQQRTQAFFVLERAESQGFIPTVLVNNAGYGLVGALEDLPPEAIHRQIQTNLCGVIWLCQAVLPFLRRQGKGFIFNISSIAGYFGFKGTSLYNATKFAVTGLSEALSQEVAPFGIYVCSVAPGPYRTDWAGLSLEKAPTLERLDPSSPYYELHALMAERYAQMDRQQPGDPRHIGRVLLRCVEMGWAPRHLILGDEARQVWERYTFLRNFPELQFISHEEEAPTRA